MPCHTDLEAQFAAFLDGAGDVVKYAKNERLGFSITYHDQGRARQYHPDFVVQVRSTGGRLHVVVGGDQGRDPSQHFVEDGSCRVVVRAHDSCRAGQVAVSLRAAAGA